MPNRFRETSGDWLTDLEAGAPDAVAAFRNIEAGRFIGVRREVRRRTAVGSAGEATAGRDELRRRIATSQEAVERAARSIAEHETDACPLEQLYAIEAGVR